MKTINNRTTEYPIDDMFLKRYSPRALSGENITKEELMTLFDAAHWAPSNYNIQPWRFVYAMRDTPQFDTHFSLLVEFNQSWCKNASALVVAISRKKTDDGAHDNICHSFDTGSAWMSLAFQASSMGLIAHGMSGFDYDMTKAKLNVPDDYSVEMMFAVGKPGKVEDLPDFLREGEKPNDRKKLEEIVFEGKFPF